MKKSFLAMMLASVILVGCKGKVNDATYKGKENINVISREEGSGTRSAFVEIVNLLEKKDEKKMDLTTKEAVIQNNTNGVLMSVLQDKSAIGYISLGYLNDKVKALKIDGADAKIVNIQNKKYKIARPFNLVYKENLDELSKDFLDYILSKDGQKVVENEKFITVKGNEKEYVSKGKKGKIVISGSTSITPLMEKLKENYIKLNSNVEIEIQSVGSSAGIKSTLENISTIGMVSRQLKEDEKEKLKNVEIAVDGIVVVVNKENSLSDISMENVKKVFKGEIKDWSKLK